MGMARRASALACRPGSRSRTFAALIACPDCSHMNTAVFMWLQSGQAIKAAKVRERLPGLQARALARRAIPIPSNLPLAEAIRRADAAQARALVIVDHQQTPIAIVSEEAVLATPEQRR